MEQEFTTFLINNGFAVAVAGYVLIVLNKTIKENTKVITELILEIKKEKEKN